MALVLSSITACDEDASTAPGNNSLEPINLDPNLQVTISTWKNAQASAYSIIFDDYCDDGTQGIQDYADTIAHNRGIPIGFGVITSQCDETEWQRAREMISNGHEIINHTHNHRCGEFFPDWCTDVWDEADFPIEIDGSTNIIETNTSVRPTFFIFPYDLSTPAMLERLKTLDYYGSRTGDKMEVNTAWFIDPFDLNYDVNFPPEDKALNQKWTLNQLLDESVMTGGYGIREVHGVDDQSWGVVSASELRVHLDYANQLTQNGQLWVGSPSDVIAYRFAREHCELNLVVQETYYSLNFGQTQDCLKHPSELTLEITADLGELSISQNEVPLEQQVHPLDDSKIIVTVHSQKGEIKMSSVQ